MRKLIFQLLWCCLFPALINAQQKSDNTILSLIQTKLGDEFTLEDTDAIQLMVNSFHKSKKSQLDHYYFRQTLNGLEIVGTESSLHLKADGEIFRFNNRFTKVNSSSKLVSPSLNPIQAVKAAGKDLRYTNIGDLKVLEHSSLTDRSQKISKGTLSRRDIPVKLVYHISDNGDLQLAWDLSIYETQEEEWWSMRVNAQTGEILEKESWMAQCNLNHGDSGHKCTKHREANSHSELHNKVPRLGEKMGSVGGYRVFAMPLAHPGEGGRTLVNNPDNATASPYGWHDTNGAAGAEYNITRGNNAHAFDAGNNNGYSPNGGGGLVFDFPLNLNQNPDLYENAAITNLFYWNNISHDVLYHYGFDESSGNFQQNNYGNGGAAGDYVYARSQVGLVCNAFFGTPSDGINPTMSMYVCNGRDGDFSNAVILHEYGHGLSNRLTGGPAAASCLGNAEQMGEGWSDFLGLILTMKPGDQGTDSRPLGDWLFNNPGGIRPYPYSTNMAINPHTYASSFNGTSQPHGIGSVWCAMVWEMTWALIAQYGFDSNFYTGTGGNNIALQLVVEGLKLQPCSPGFVDGRNGILAADQALYGGAHQCLIWTAFAKRGLGASANQGSSQNRSDGAQAFNVPASCVNSCVVNANLTGTVSGTTNTKAQNTITSTQTLTPSADVSYKAGVKIRLMPGFQVQNNGEFSAKIETCTNFNNPTNSPVSLHDEQFNSQSNNQRFKEKERPKALTAIPNPFHSTTTLSFYLDRSVDADLSIYDINGRKIKQIANSHLKEGPHQFVWKAKGVAPGVYLAKLIYEKELQTVRIVLSK